MGINQIDTLNQKRLEKRVEVETFLNRLQKVSTLEGVNLNIDENQQALEGLIEKLSKDTINISIVAEVSNGKSTFLNALVFNEPVLESKIGETTAKVFNIQYGKEFSINGKFCVDLQELKREISAENSLNLKAVSEERTLPNKQSVITLPNENLKKGIELYDTPGFTTINEKAMLNLIKNAVSKSDATILLLDISQGIKSSEALFIKNILHQIPIDKRFIVLNKYDTVFDEDELILKSKEEIEEEVALLVEQMKKILYNLQEERSQSIETFTLSSKKALVGKITKNEEKLKESRFPIFEELFWNRVVEAKDELFEDRVELFNTIKEKTTSHLFENRILYLKQITALEVKLERIGKSEHILQRVEGKLEELKVLNMEISKSYRLKITEYEQKFLDEVEQLLSLNLEGEISTISTLDRVLVFPLSKLYKESIITVYNNSVSYLENMLKAFFSQALTEPMQEKKRLIIKEINRELNLTFRPKKYNQKRKIEETINRVSYRVKAYNHWDYSLLIDILNEKFNPKKEVSFHFPMEALPTEIGYRREEIFRLLQESDDELMQYFTMLTSQLEEFTQSIKLKKEYAHLIAELTASVEEIDNFMEDAKE